jgi:hypothetical protein
VGGRLWTRIRRCPPGIQIAIGLAVVVLGVVVLLLGAA